ncbi:MAG: acyl-CoA dehydrogenase [Myxococcales bacterium]|nr:acyl-CoA dehydrogenase [Myxococcales bacterium]
MNFDPSEEQHILRDQVRRFAEAEIGPRAAELDEAEKFDVEMVRRMGEMGLFGMFVSEEYGGSDVGYVAYIMAVEEIARVDGSHAATVAAGNSLGIGPIYYFGNEEQKRQWLPPLCTGEILASFGLTEANAGSDASASKTTAVLDGNEWVINGSKIFITNSASPISGICVVQAITGKRDDGRPEISCILVPNGTRGFIQKEMHGKLMWRASNTGELFFEDCRVPKDNLLGKRGDGFKQMMQTLDGGRLSIGAMGLGGAQGAFEAALKYSQERSQFGKRIGDFQVNAYKLAEAATRLSAARFLLYNAAWLREQKRPFTQAAAMAKLYCSEIFRDIAYDAVQIHGGYGLMKEYAVERFFRDQRLLEIGEGTSEIQRLVIARRLGLDPIF